ncbi:MAG: amidohydrolase family protein [Bacteroidota bacterium]
MRRYLFALLLSCLTLPILAQVTFPTNGIKDNREDLYVFTNAIIHTAPDQKIEQATMVIRKGKIEAIGNKIALPKGALIVDLQGKHIYPSFIDIYSDYGIPEAKEGARRRRGEQQIVSKKEGAYMWNQALKPEFRAHEHFKVDAKSAKSFLKSGFGAVLSHQMDGISRGTGTVVLLGDANEHEVMVKDVASHHLSFKKGTSTQSYPGSLMGGIALLRQTYLDAEWYKKSGHQKEYNISLAAWNEVKTLPQIFEVRDLQEAFRASKLGKEYGITYTMIGRGDEYKRIEAVKATGATFILPLNFPKAYDVEDPFDALEVSLSDLKHWELAPSNPARLVEAGINIVITTHGLKDKGQLIKQIQQAMEHGLSEVAAFKALTTTPARLLGIDKEVGSLATGKLANFIISSGPIFEKGSKIYHNWVKGKPHVFSQLDAVDLSGKYNLKVGDQEYNLLVEGVPGKAEMKMVINDSTSIKVKHRYEEGLLYLSYKPQKEQPEVVRLSGTVQREEWSGRGNLTDGQWVSWNAKQTSSEDQNKAVVEKKDVDVVEGKEVGEVIYPFLAFGNTSLPRAKNYLIKNATVWTNEQEGILKNADVYVSNGKIAEIGINLAVKDAAVIDATGKHLTCGVVDEHSHIAISRGVNECTQANTAEVRIGDVIDAEDIDIYRQLAGGVTTSQLLHGSCNPVGGQSAIVKLRWGYTPEEMKFENAAGFIKFALGENVKRSRASSNSRYPNTRMGVEQVFEDAFTRAKEYEQQKAAGGADFRKDLEMEAVLEILNKKRFISCHSYVQSEINMLMHVAEAHDFTVNTFTHILEGYKVADKMKAHGAGGSSFSDWWAYKYEVIDAIPYNGALMHEQGVVTAFNSDDAEMARRLNQEAGKALMYGNVPEEEAWKFVTLNPAKLLHIDDRVGSIKVGKDADLVIWSDYPMSIYAKAEKTFIDGIKFFDREEDKKMQATIQAERNRLIQKTLAAKNGGARMQVPRKKRSKHYHCDDSEDEMVD